MYIVIPIYVLLRLIIFIYNYLVCCNEIEYSELYKKYNENEDVESIRKELCDEFIKKSSIDKAKANKKFKEKKQNLKILINKLNIKKTTCGLVGIVGIILGIYPLISETIMKQQNELNITLNNLIITGNKPLIATASTATPASVEEVKDLLNLMNNAYKFEHNRIFECFVILCCLCLIEALFAYKKNKQIDKIVSFYNAIISFTE